MRTKFTETGLVYYKVNIYLFVIINEHNLINLDSFW